MQLWTVLNTLTRKKIWRANLNYKITGNENGITTQMGYPFGNSVEPYEMPRLAAKAQPAHLRSIATVFAARTKKNRFRIRFRAKSCLARKGYIRAISICFFIY